MNDILKEDNQIHNEHCKDYEFTNYILGDVNKIIAIGDIHGDFIFCIKLLVIAGVIELDKKNNDIIWTGGDTVVVQVGDQIDRCRPFNTTCSNPSATVNDENSDIAILNLFNDIHKKAVLKGGAVISLLGNHELMNVDGDMRYVSYEGIMGFGNNYEEGFKKRRELFRPGGKYAKLLACTRQSYVIVGPFIFIHAGIVPEFINGNLKEFYKINAVIRKYLLGINNNSSIMRFKNNNSLFWDRTLGNIATGSSNSNYYCINYLKKVLDILELKGMIIGHTPQPFKNNLGINSTCNNSLWRIDIGGSDAFSQYKHNINVHSHKPQVLCLRKNNNGTYNSEILCKDVDINNRNDIIKELKKKYK